MANISSSIKKNSSIVKFVKNSNKISKFPFKKVGLVENIKQIKIKVIRIDSLFKNISSLQQKRNKIFSRNIENRKRSQKEDSLEKSPKTDKESKKLPSSPSMGFLEGIKRFFLNMILGWFVLKFLKYLPDLIKIIKPLGAAVDWILDFSGKLLNGLVTFVDWGFKAYEFTRGAIKKIGGEKSLKVFDKFSSALTTFMNLAIIAGMLSTMGGGSNRGGGRSLGRRGGTRFGKPRVTTSGGKPQGRPDIRNPFRQRPNVTQGGKGGGFRFPGTGPKVTGSTGGFRFPNIKSFNPKGFISGAKTFGIGLVLDYALNELVNKPLEEAAVSRRVNKLSSLSPEERKKRIQFILAEIKKEKGWQSGGGGTFDKVLSLGGETQSELKVRQLEETLARLELAGYYGGGLVTVGAAGGGMISRAGQIFGGIKRGFGQITRKLSFNLPSITDIIPGSKIGGQENIEKIFPNPEGKRINPLEYLTDTGNLFSETDYLGPIFSIVSKSILGSKITNDDYRNIGLGINAWIASGINERKLKGGISPAFAEGGLVESMTSEEDISKWAEESAKKLISPKVSESNRQLFRNVLLQDKQIYEEQETEEGQDPNLEVGPGGTVTGGNADFWTLVAIASLESGSPQGRADVAQSIYNRLASGIYSGNTIKELIVSGNGRQYQPVGRAVGEFRAISDKESAINAVMVANKLNRSQAEKFIDDTASAIQNKSLQESARQFVGGRTDFWAEGLVPPSNGVGYAVRDGHRFGWFVGPAAIAYGRKNPGPASAPSLGDIVVMGGGITDIGLGRGYGSAGSKISGELGRYLNKTLAPGKDFLRVTEHPQFGGVKGRHAPRSYHYSGRAIDIGAWSWEQPKILSAIAQFNKMKGVKPVELLHAKNEPSGHSDHVHVAYEEGGVAGKHGPEFAKIGEKGPEAVLDADTTAGLEKRVPGFLASLNQANFNGAIRVLQSYAQYESGFQDTIIINNDESNDGEYAQSSSESPMPIMFGAAVALDPYEILDRLPG